MQNKILQNRALIAIPIILSIGVYLNSLFGQFVSDDIYQVLKNPWITEPGHIKDIFFSSVWNFLPEGSSSPYYRPMMYVSYLISHSISGVNSWGYHLINILLHAANSAALFILALSLTERAGFAEDKNYASLFALGAASLFAVHTINTEAVNWVASVPELSFSLCFILSLYFFGKRRIFPAALLFFISLLYKETAIVLLPMLFVFDILFDTDRKRSASEYAKRYWPFGAALILYLVMRVIALGSLTAGTAGGGEADGPFSTYEYAINIVPLLFEYIKLLFYPVDLIFYAHMRWETVGSVLAVKSIVDLLLGAGLVCLLWRIRRRAPIVALAVVWIFLPLLPIVASGWTKGFPLFAERYLYLSTGGFALLISYLFVIFFKKQNLAKAGIVLFIIIVAALSIATVKRNTAWSSSFTLWQDTATKAPYVTDARVNYANELSKRNRLDEALAEYKAALKLDPARASTHNGLGILYAKKGFMSEAAREFETALALNPDRDEREAITRNLMKARELLREGGR